MKKHLQIILSAVAFICFMLAFILDISQFGSDFQNFFKNIDFKNIGIVITIIIAIGLFCGLFLFRKYAYNQRISFTIPIAFIIFSFADVINMAVFDYGLNQEYNYFSAKKDIKNGVVQVIETGLIIQAGSNEEQQAEEEIHNQFGYKIEWAGCIVWPGIEKYNRVVEKYLDERNGKSWRMKEKLMLDSVQNKFK